MCEQVFSWLSCYSRMTQKMSQHVFMFFLLYLCDLHNTHEEQKLQHAGFSWRQQAPCIQLYIGIIIVSVIITDRNTDPPKQYMYVVKHKMVQFWMIPCPFCIILHVLLELLSEVGILPYCLPCRILYSGWDEWLGFTQWGWYQLGMFLNHRSILSHGTTGWDGQLGTFLNCPSCPMVRWDGMDSWDLPSESGTCWERS